MVADTIARTVNRLVADRAADSDSDLLRRFAADRDEAAFAALVRRHGPMVFGVCRRTLGHLHDAEDAFQAVFLVLARKAHTVRPDGVSRWLYGVAVRVANKARVRRARRQGVPAELNEIPAPVGPPPADWLPLVDAALARLPERDRGPILLCDLLGRSRAEAAAELGVGEGTLSSRLARARLKLRDRLTRLGIVPGVLTVAALAPEPVPAALVESTGVAATPAARVLAEGVLRSMAATKLTQWAAVGLCVVGTVTAGIVWLPAAGAGPTPVAKEAPKDSPPKAPAKPARSDAERFRGTWVVGSATQAGKDREVAGWVGETMTFDRDKVRFARFVGQQQEYKLDPGWDQKRIDFKLTQNAGAGPGTWRHQIPAIYRFEGENLHLVLGVMDQEDRPVSFDRSDTGPPFTHLILTRTKPDKDPAADQRKALEGTWVAVAIEHYRVRQAAPGLKLTFAAGRLQTSNAEVNGLEAEYELDVSRTPHHLDLTVTGGRGSDLKAGMAIKGLYTLDGGLLALSFGQPDGPRPTALGGSDGNPVYYLRREGDDRGPPPGTAPAPGTPGARLRQLQVARVIALRTQMEGQFERVKIGKDPLIQYIQAVQELAAAELEVAETKEARIAAVERMLRELTVCEKQMTELQQAGLQTAQGVAQATAARLKAEIELEKLKAAK